MTPCIYHCYLLPSFPVCLFCAFLYDTPLFIVDRHNCVVYPVLSWSGFSVENSLTTLFFVVPELLWSCLVCIVAESLRSIRAACVSVCISILLSAYFYAAIRSCIPWFFPPLLLISRDDPADGCYIVGRTFGIRNLVTSGPMRRRMVCRALVLTTLTRILGREMTGHKAGVVLLSADFLVLATGSRTNSVSSVLLSSRN